MGITGRQSGSRVGALALLASTGGLGSTGCLAELWPSDGDGEPALGVCMSTRRQPTLDATADERIAVDRTDNEASLIDVEAEGRGADFVGAVHVTHGTGTVELGCETLPVTVYRTFSDNEQVEFVALVVKRDRLYRVQFECRDARLVWVYYRGTDGTASTSESAMGTCTEVATPISARVTFPAIDMPLPRTVTGYTIDGPEISLATDGTGSIVLDSGSHELFAFSEWRCSENCVPADWRQLDLLIWDRLARRISYAVLDLSEPDEVTVFAGATLPGFVDDVGVRRFAATFSVP